MAEGDSFLAIRWGSGKSIRTSFIEHIVVDIFILEDLLGFCRHLNCTSAYLVEVREE